MNAPDPHRYTDKPGIPHGRAAVWQARLVLLVMINIAQLWILSATVEAALAGAMNHLLPLVAASLVCWLIAFSIFMWWKPASRPRRSYSVSNASKDNRI
jgi:hypothetical protein